MAITFQSASHREGYEVVEDFLTLCELAYEKSSDTSGFLIPYEDAPRLGIEVMPWNNGEDALVVFTVWLVRKPPLSPELMKELLLANYGEPVGHFAIDDEGDLGLRHVIGGSQLDEAEFRRAVSGLVHTGATEAERIIATYGGTKFGNWAR